MSPPTPVVDGLLLLKREETTKVGPIDPTDLYVSSRSADGTETALTGLSQWLANPTLHQRTTGRGHLYARAIFRAPSWEAAEQFHEELHGLNKTRGEGSGG